MKQIEEPKKWDEWYQRLPKDITVKLSIHDFKRLGDLFGDIFEIERNEQLERLYRAVVACLNHDNPENLRALKDPLVICAKIPAKLWNEVKAAARAYQRAAKKYFGEFARW